MGFGVRTLDELIDRDNPAIGLVRKWVEEAEVACEILAPSGDNGRVLHSVQVTTGTVLGAIAYETGGILVESGWLRFLGSGNAKLPRNLADWNEGRSHGFRLVADDVVGGFFATNETAFGDDVGTIYYWAPDNLDWEPLGFAFADFLRWSLTSCISDFYQNLRWQTWKQDVAELPADQCFGYEPVLWTKEGSIKTSTRRPVPVAEAYASKVDARGKTND